MALSLKAKSVATWAGIVLVLVLLIIKTFFIGYYRIPQNGMYPGLPAGSRLFAVRRPYQDVASVQRGDVVVFVREENEQRYNYIWRVIALPGEQVEAAGESLTVNGKPVERQRLWDADGLQIFREQIGNVSYEVALDPAPQHPPPNVSVTVPPGQFFVLGDNRLNARDSRYFGPSPFSSITGKKL